MLTLFGLAMNDRSIMGARATQGKTSRMGRSLGFPPDADGNGNYAFFDAANYALIQMTGGVTAISAV